ncbi:maleylpyruvate isomerase family mycothiol-dependent enzyme [Corynebacterium lubricantis]|uniref:maleylpyruvate isomerase family mycothiol-dependent enzyme n=1 Tax=Corynebacterium lubricantis TaxID=541095 RepID=UPI000371FD67|nr:maleylpyruvate isomerase family mycothiol-dependent enzyme [Corynebacterium lubricantis]
MKKKKSSTDKELWHAIDAQRERVADLLDNLEAGEWEQPSLCAGWTVKNVAAHLTLQQMSLPQVMWLALRTRGNLNSIIHKSAILKSNAPSDHYPKAIRNMIGSTKHNFGVTPQETHMDIIVHGFDIAIPLGKTIDVPPQEVLRAAKRVWSYQGAGLAEVFTQLGTPDLSFKATDVDWQVGSGPEARGPVAAILLVLTGRTAWLDQLSGPGADKLRASADKATKEVAKTEKEAKENVASTIKSKRRAHTSKREA